MQTQGPVARRGFRLVTQILRAGNFCPFKGVTPVMGSGERRIWTRSVHPEPSPRRSFGFFPIAGKETRPAGRTPLRTTTPIRNLPPHPSRLRRATFPPGGRLKGSRRRNSPPLRKPAPPCFKRKTLLQYGRRNPSREGERPWNSTAWWPRPRAPSPTAW